MLKYKSPDGRVFDSIEEAKKYFCSHFSTIECMKMCPLNIRLNPKKEICKDFVIRYSDSAARLMGYEIIEDEQADVQEAKADSGKPRPSLVPPALIDGVMRIRDFGTARYGDPNNWRKVDADRYHDALLRHILAMWEDWGAVDPDSGMPHLWHAACNIAFLMQYMEEENGLSENKR